MFPVFVAPLVANFRIVCPASARLAGPLRHGTRERPRSSTFVAFARACLKPGRRETEHIGTPQPVQTRGIPFGDILRKLRRAVKHPLHIVHVAYVPIANVLIETRSALKHAQHKCYGTHIPSRYIAIELVSALKCLAHVGDAAHVPTRHTSVFKSRAVSVLWVFTQAFFNRIIKDSIFNVYVLSFPYNRWSITFPSDGERIAIKLHLKLRDAVEHLCRYFQRRRRPRSDIRKVWDHYSGKHLAHVFHFSHIPVRYL